MGTENDGLEKGIQALVKLGTALATVQRVKNDEHSNGTPVAIIPDGFKAMSLAGFLPDQPDRVRAVATFVSRKSFCEYLVEQKKSATRIFARTLNAPYQFRAIIDYHEPDGVPSWATHEAVLTLTETDEWKEWSGASGKEFEQELFAQFIEDHQPDIIDPDGATMLELARTLRATQGAEFKNFLNLQNGDINFSFEEKTGAGAGKDGTLAIPEIIRIKMSPFLGIPEQTIEARFRYRLTRPRLLLGYRIIRPQQLVKKIVEAAADLIMQETEVPIFYGECVTQAK